MEGDLIALVEGCRLHRGKDAAKDAAKIRAGFELIGDFRRSAIPIEVIGNLLDVPHDEREPLRRLVAGDPGALEPVIGPEGSRVATSVKDSSPISETLVERRAQARKPPSATC